METWYQLGLQLDDNIYIFSFVFVLMVISGIFFILFLFFFGGYALL